MRKTLIAANWKMHAAPAGFDAPASPYRTKEACDVVVFPCSTDFPKVRAAELVFGGQCARPETAGAFTGDLSITQLKETGCRYVLCGHSERRKNHGETDSFVIEQVIAALETGLHPVLCIGETADERKAGKTHEVLKRHLHGLPKADDGALVVAYEPVWAIGSGDAAEPDDVADAHAFIRKHLPAPETTRILYGGSVDAENAATFLRVENVDGLLVGGASLKPDEFGAIVEAAAA